MIISPAHIPMMFSDGKHTTRDIWKLVTGKRISRHGLHDLLMFHYFPWGRTLVEGIHITYPYDSDSLFEMFNAVSHWDALDLDIIDRILTENLRAIQSDLSEPVYVGMSGGPDSSLLAAKLKALGINIKGFTVVASGIDEKEDAYRVAEELGIDIDVVTIYNDDILEELPMIVEKLGIPYDRGSLIPSYFIFKNYPRKTIVLGDGAEPIFEPSYRSRLRVAMGTEQYSHKLECLTLNDLHDLTGEWICIESPFIFQNKLTHVALFDMISETPFYYLHKLVQLIEEHTVHLPYIDPNLYAISLRMKELHVWYPYRKHLYTLIGRYMNSKKVKQSKKALKIKIIPSVIQRYLDETILAEIGIDPHQAKDDWTRYILSLLSIWLKLFEQHGGIIELV